MNINNKVVIFGATGTIGAYATIELKKKGYEVLAIGRRRSDNGFFADNGIEYISMDISDAKSFLSLPNEVYAVIHLAGAIPARMQGYFPQNYIDSIVTGTLNVLNYCIFAKADRIIFAQSIADVLYLYGNNAIIPAEAERRFPLNSDHTVYSICKNAAVDLIEHYFAKYGLKRFVLRFPNIYVYHPNPYYYLDGKKRWQSYRFLIEKAKAGEDIELWGNPKLQRDIVYVKDCVQVIVKSLEAIIDGGIYNVGTGIGTSMREQIEYMIDVFSPQNHQSKIIECPNKPDSVSYIMDISKTQKDLGYMPQYTYKNYLIDMKLEMKNEPFKLLWGSATEYMEP